MASIKVIIYDPTGSKKTPVELPNDVPMRRLIPALVSKWDYPPVKGPIPSPTAWTIVPLANACLKMTH